MFGKESKLIESILKRPILMFFGENLSKSFLTESKTYCLIQWSALVIE